MDGGMPPPSALLGTLLLTLGSEVSFSLALPLTCGKETGASALSEEAALPSDPGL